MVDDSDVAVIVRQAFGPLRVFRVAFVRPPFDHVAQLVVQSTGIVVVVREFVSDRTTRCPVIQRPANDNSERDVDGRTRRRDGASRLKARGKRLESWAGRR